METPYQNHQQQLQPNPTHMILIRLMSKRRTWVALFVLVYGILLYSSWNLLQTLIIWYNTEATPPAAAVYASLMLGAVFGLISMVAALAVAVPAMLVTWITILVLLAFCGRPRRDLVVEGKELTVEISRLVVKILVKEGNIVAALCAVLGYFLLVRNNSNSSNEGD